MDGGDTALVVAGGAAAVGGTGLWLWLWSTGWFRIGDTPRTILGRPLTSQEQLQRYADLGGVPHGAGEWRQVPAAGLPPGAHQVPIVSLRFTPLVDGLGRVSYEDHFPQALAVWRQRNADAGRGGEDPRCSLYRFWEESGAGRFCWNYNYKNAKITPYATRASILEPGTPHVWTTNVSVVAIYLLTDRGHSFDSYPAYPDWHTALADGRDFWIRNQRSSPTYREVIAGYEQGGLDGLIRAEKGMHDGGYSGGVWAAKERACRSFWARGTRKCGAAGWVR